MKSLYEPDVIREVRERIESLTPDATARWGKMTVGQMLAHVTEAQDVMNGAALEDTPWLIRLFGPLIRRAVLSPKPYAHSIRTHPQYVITHEAEFTDEKQRLLESLERFAATEGDTYVHDIFGPMDPAERGWASYKHVDHHLRQFGA